MSGVAVSIGQRLAVMRDAMPRREGLAVAGIASKTAFRCIRTTSEWPSDHFWPSRVGLGL